MKVLSPAPDRGGNFETLEQFGETGTHFSSVVGRYRLQAIEELPFHQYVMYMTAAGIAHVWSLEENEGKNKVVHIPFAVDPMDSSCRVSVVHRRVPRFCSET